MDHNRNIKIVDFGMAALQPSNKWLNTSCGSPHYASPEVIKAEQYRGDKADVWSCGVILYAMLTGTLPFDSTGNWRDVVNAVIAGEYTFPECVSRLAEDLISRILQRDPRQRISIKQMWQHPLIKKYDKLDSTDENGMPYIGPAPPLTSNDCGRPLKHRNDIDAEILRNLQNLWHGASEEELAQRLLDEVYVIHTGGIRSHTLTDVDTRPNHEKILYSKLLRFRDEQLENYAGPPMDYSISDYHHNPPPPSLTVRRSSTRVSMQPLSRGTKRVSQYSLLNPIMPPPKRSLSQNVQRHSSVAETERTDQSYDPYRPSRVRLSKGEADHARITVLRGASQQASGTSSSRILNRNSIRHPGVIRAQAADDVYSIASSSSPAFMHSARASHIQQLSTNRRISRTTTRSTMASRRSATNPSSSFVARNAASYKRNVSFVHNRKRSLSDGHPRLRYQDNHTLPFTLKERFVRDEAQAQAQMQLQPRSQRMQGPASILEDHRETPELDECSPVRSKKPLSKDSNNSSGKKGKRQSYRFRDDARKVSVEIEKLCDDAFNHATMPLSIHSPPSAHQDSRRTSDTNPSSATSFSVHEDQVKIPVTRHERAREISVNYHDRPLPKPPATERMIGTDHLGSYTHRELAKTRDLLKKRQAESGLSPGYLDEVIAHLERLMQPSAIRIKEDERRAISTPETSYGIERKDTFDSILAKGNFGFRSASDPTKRDDSFQKGATIRLVDGPISPVKPLTVRKKSQSSTPSAGSPRAITPIEYLTTTEDLYRHEFEDRRLAGLSMLSEGLDPIEEADDKENFDPVDRDLKGQLGEYKRRGWFRRHQPAQGSRGASSDTAPLPPKKSFGNLRDSKEQKRKSDAPSEESQTSEQRKAGKGRFFKIFSNKHHSKGPYSHGTGEFVINDEESVLTEESSRNYDRRQMYMHGGLQNSSHDGFINQAGKGDKAVKIMEPPTINRTIQPQHQNWFARFLRIKPAVSVLCFQVSKVRARKEVTRLFIEWKKYGMRDVVVDKVNARIWARVDGTNCKYCSAFLHFVKHCHRIYLFMSP